MRLCHPPDGSTSPKYKLRCFITINFFSEEKNALAFNRDRCCHLVLCSQLIPFHSVNFHQNHKFPASFNLLTGFYPLFSHHILGHSKMYHVHECCVSLYLSVEFRNFILCAYLLFICIQNNILLNKWIYIGTLLIFAIFWICPNNIL